MGSAFHQLCPRYSGTLTPTAPTAIRLWETFTFTFLPHYQLLLGKNLLLGRNFFQGTSCKEAKRLSQKLFPFIKMAVKYEEAP